MHTLIRGAMRLAILWLAIVLSPPFAHANGIDVNTASADELTVLPGIGEVKAAAIVAHREQNGPFTTVEQLDDVSGIGPATLASIRALVTTGAGEASVVPASTTTAAPATGAATTAAAAGPTVNVNTASASELESLPGIGPSKAAAIIDDRTANGPFTSCQDLARVTGIGTATIANIGALCATQ